MNVTRKTDTLIKSTKRSFEVIEGLKELDGARPTELSEHLGMTKSTVHNHLSTMNELEYLVKEGDEYHLGMRFLRLGEYARSRKEIFQLTEPRVTELAVETDERSQFLIEEHGFCVVVHRAFGSHAVNTEPREKRQFMHSTASGKCILANYPESKVNNIIERRGLPERTSYTITDREELFEELNRVRERGYGFNDEENIEGLRAVAAPIISPNGQVAGAISIAGPSKRLLGDWFRQEIPRLIQGITNELELALKYE